MLSIINNHTHSARRAFLIIFILAFIVRLFFLFKVDERYIIPHDRWEGSAIAMSLVESGTFADPYMIPTGPTTHHAPMVPGILAVLWMIFGLGPAGGYSGWIFSILVASVLWALLPWLAEQFGFGRQPGFLAGLAGAFIITWPGNQEILTGLLLLLMAVAFVKRWDRESSCILSSLLLGLMCGIAIHLHVVLLPVVLGWILFELWWWGGRRRWINTGILVLGILIACVPWTYRNYKTFDTFIFVRGNFGLELRMGNHEGAAAAMDVMDYREEFRHPRTHLKEAELVKELGEAEYMKRAKREAMGWIRSHPGQFIKLSLSRIAYWWFGPFYDPLMAVLTSLLTLLALAGLWFALPHINKPQSVALLLPLLLFPMVYYVVAYMPRYRIPIDWIILLLAANAVWHWVKRDHKWSDDRAVDI